jgi:hypothetical protein
VWTELLSGFIGAFLGAIATYWAARSQTTRILKADRDARIAVAKEERLLMREADSRAAAAEALDALFVVQQALPRMREPAHLSLARNQGPEGVAAREALDALKRSVRVTAARLDSLRLRQLLESASGLVGRYAYMAWPDPVTGARAQSDVDAYFTWVQKCLHRYLEAGEDVLARSGAIPRVDLTRAGAEVWQPPAEVRPPPER